ncbi:slipin family protein [Sphingobacterium psychroaquaticum]|uniref:slipin family protein n=1 Tax=Sphingobacterium psychroaquaticum TaxID=561061 RepID=UPI00106B32BF|nr:slipin family protein [Sphingobacterium psychroaquaticum]QBQ41406.1 slipin family protein [Sphingobacterium psychroaquaticum]
MKRVTVDVNQVGLVVKNNVVKRALRAGSYWIGFGAKLETYNMSHNFVTPHNIDALLQVDGFKEMVEVVEVADDQICIVYLNNNFYNVLSAGRHFFWKGLQTYRFQIEDISTIDIKPSVSRQLLASPAFSYYVCYYTIEPFEQALLFVDGAFVKILEPGNYYWWKNATTITVIKTDMRVTAVEITGQEILTKDKAQIRVNFSAQYQVKDIVKALGDNKEYEKQLYTLLQLVLRRYIGQMTLDELMDSKSEISKYVIETTSTEVAALGLALLNGGVKDIILPGDVREIMNQVLIAEKRAQANIITRREETASTRSLLNTAKLMEENAMLFKLKEMEYVEKIAEKINSISVSGNGQIVDQLKQLFVKS